MRHTLFLILIWMPLLICATDKNVNITIKLSTELSQTEQWIYASGYIGANEYAILDSVKVSKGDIKKKLSFDISQGMSIYILCAEKGPVNLFFDIEPNTNCEIEIDENMDGRYPHPMKGNDMFNEFLTFYNKILYTGKKSRDQSLPEDSIRYYKAKLTEAYIKEIHKTQYSTLAWVYILWLPGYAEERSEEEPFRSVIQYAQQKFPNNDLIERLSITSPEPATAKSKAASERIRALIKKRYYVEPKDTTMGAKLQLAFPHISKKKINTDSIAEEYVLVDFWASWCGMCLAAMPDIRKLEKQYQGDFVVIPVSCDLKPEAWRNAMKKHNMPEPQYILTKQGYDDFFHKYQVGNGVPYYTLIAPDGKVMKAPSGTEEIATVMEHYCK